MRYCIKGGQIVNPDGKRRARLDIMIADGRIEAVGPELDAGDAEVLLAEGLHILPGLVDMHVHLREPGREDEETIATGAAAAVAGGFTAVAAMPNTEPPIDQPALVEYIKRRAVEADLARVCVVGCLSKGQRGEEMAELGEMARAGAAAFSNDGVPLSNAAVTRHAMEYGKIFGLPILLHEEDAQLVEDGVMHEGEWSTRLGLKGIPALAEEVALARDLMLAEATGAAVHICHVSTAGSVALIRRAKQRGIMVTAEATPHHLILTDADLAGYDTNAKVNPPLRGREDLDELRRGLADGTLDVIASDHAPHTREEKNVEFSLAPNGLIGLESSLGLVLTELVKPGLMTLEDLVWKMSLNPRRLLGLPVLEIRPGEPADLTIVDLERDWTFDPAALRSKSRNTPFGGRVLHGKAMMTFVNGKMVFIE